MSITRLITDIPRNRVNFVIAIVKSDGGIFERKEEPDGEVTIIATYPDIPTPAMEKPEIASPEFKWMEIAKKELGVKEEDGIKNNERISAYHATTRGGEMPDSVPWCSSFVNFCIESTGVQGTKSKLARSWLEWGVEAPDFVPGCVVILSRGSYPRGHVGFYVGKENGRIRLLGGNQDQKVSVTSYDVDRVIGRRVLA